MKYQSKFWSDYFVYYDILLKVIPYRELFQQIVQKVEVQPGLKILDLGAGTGNLQYFLRDQYEVVGLDNSKEALARLKEKFPATCTVHHSITQKLPFQDEQFDRIVSNNVLYTLEKKDWIPVIWELHRITKPGGKVVISNLNKDFKAVNIYRDHIKKSLKQKGTISTIKELLHLAWPTYKMLQFNREINKKYSQGSYTFLEADEQRELFESNGFQSVSETISVYAGQAKMDVFVRG